MKNILKDRPKKRLHGRTQFTTKFVEDCDIEKKTCLDIGCGWGWFELNALKRKVKKIVGLEISDSNLEAARQNISDRRAQFKVGSAIDLPFPDSQFDTVVSWEVIEHIPKNQEPKMFKEVARVLKDGGVFYMSTPKNSLWCNIFDPAWWLIGHRHYSKIKIIKASSRNKLVVEKLIFNGGWWELIGMNNLYISKWIFHRKPFAEKFFDSRQDKEFEKEKGFTNIFIKFKKVKRAKSK